MKLINKIGYITFVVNIAILLFNFIVFPMIVIIVPDAFDKVFANNGNNPYNYTITVVLMIAFFHWIYCIWFLFKYDRYSKSIFPLFIFNVLYAPIYFYRVKIKKRPLRNKINKPKQEFETEDKTINEEDFVELSRNTVFELIYLWASKERQLEYRKNVLNAHVSSELFFQWGDLYCPNSNDFNESFNIEELELLSDFDKTIKDISIQTPETLLVIEEFIKTKEWTLINEKAIEIKDKLVWK